MAAPYDWAGCRCSGASTAMAAGFAEWALKAQQAHREGSLHDRQAFEGSTMDGNSLTV